MAETNEAPSPGTVVDAGAMPLQQLLDGGINAFACQLLSESFHTSAVLKAFPDNPVAFSVDGVKITLERIAEPRHARIRRELGLPPLE
jgi:hypothetical protein